VADGDGFRYLEVTPEEIEATFAGVDTALDVVRTLPAVAPEHASGLTQATHVILGSADPSILDTLRTAKEQGALLFTDDIGLRRIAQLEGIACAWSQLLLTEGRRRGLVSEDDCVNAVAALLSARYHYVSIDATTLIREWRRSGHDVSPTLALLLDQLADPSNEKGSVVGVLADFLLVICSPGSETDPITNLLQDIVCRFRRRLGDLADEVLKAARGAVASRLRVARRFRRLPPRLMSTTALIPASAIGAELDAESDQDFDETLGSLLDLAFEQGSAA
jgi:hypothetical protein